MRRTRTTFSPLPTGAHSDWSRFPKARSYAKEFDSRDGAVRHTGGVCKGTRATDKAGGRHAYISRVSPVHQQTQVSSLTFERGESRLSDDNEHHEMGGHNYIASGGVVPRGEQPGIGSYLPRSVIIWTRSLALSLKTQVPPNTQHNDFLVEMSSFEKIR